MPDNHDRQAWLACPACHYDLNGLADGRCPECGVEFTRAQLRSAAERRAERWLDVPIGSLAILGSFAAMFSFWVSTWKRSPGLTEKQLFLALASVLFAVAWVLKSRRAGSVLPGAMLWLVLPAAAALRMTINLPFVSVGILAYVVAMAMFPSLGLIAITQSCRRMLRTAAACLATFLAVYGTKVVATSVVGLRAGEHWSRLNRPFNLDRMPGRFMTNREGIVAGILIGVTGIAIACLAVWALRPTRDGRESQMPTTETPP